MKRTAILAMILLGLVGCREEPPAGRTAPVYKVTATGLSSDAAARLEAAFDLPELALDESGVAGFADAATFLTVPVRKLEPGALTPSQSEDQGEVVFEGFDFEAINRIRVLDPDDAAERVAAALETAGLAPDNATPRISNTRFEAVGIDDSALIEQPIDTTVSYEFRLGELPLEGPGAKLRVALDGDGRVISLHHALRRLEPAGSVAILEDAAAADRCATWTTTGDGAGKITEATLGYYAPPLAERLERLEPSFRCHSELPNGAVGQVYFVPAAVDARAPTLQTDEPVRTAQEASPAPAAIAPVASPFARDDVGSEGTGPCSGLQHTATNLASFNNRMTANGVAVQFSWVNAAAWEQDWKDPSKGGHDDGWVDDVDMAYWQGHGWPEGFGFADCSANDDDALRNTDALWGNRNAEWISLFTCLVLAGESGGQSWAQRWGGAFDRLHQINSFDTISYHSSSHGGVFVNFMMSLPYPWWPQPMTVQQAWAQASIADQPPQVVWATMGVLSNGNLSNFNDYFWGRGPVGPDIPAAQKQGYWRIWGGS